LAAGSGRSPAPPDVITNIKIYSKLPAVELFESEKSMGELKADAFPDRVFE
jgi:hypothetical protein